VIPVRARTPRELVRVGDGEGSVERRSLCDVADLGEDPRLAEWIAPEHGDRALRRCEQAGREREQSRLAGCVRACEADDRALWDRQRAVPQRPIATEALAEPPCVERRAHATRRATVSRRVEEISARML